MTGFHNKLRTSESGYFYVYKVKGGHRSIGTKIQYRAKVSFLKYESHHTSEKEAAIAVDKILIKNGYEPINVLKKQPE